MRKNLLAFIGLALLALTLPLGFNTDNNAPSPATVLAQQAIASGADVYCAGHISAEPVKTNLQIMGSEDKQASIYSTGNKVIYLSQGAKEGLKEKDVFQVVRPKGKFSSEVSKKKLGYLNEEIGIVRVLAAQEATATAEVIFSCEEMKQGDLLLPFEKRNAPQVRSYKPLELYNQPAQKADALIGQLVAFRYDRPTASERSVGHLDLGSEQGVKAGDYFTVFNRAEGTTTEMFAKTRSYGTSLVAKQNNSGKTVAEMRAMPARVAGEVVIVHVEKKTATAIVTRQTSEIMLGDFVERQD